MSREIRERENVEVDHPNDLNFTGRTGSYETRVVRAGEEGALAAESGTRITRPVSLIRREFRIKLSAIAPSTISMGDLSAGERMQALNAAKMSAPQQK